MAIDFHFKKNKIEFSKYFPGKVIKCYAAGMFFALIASCFEMLRPEIIARVIDGIAGAMPLVSEQAAAEAAAGITSASITNMIFLCSMAVIAVTALSQLARYFCQLNVVKAGEYFVKNIRDMMFTHILKLPIAWHSSNKTGDMIQRCTRDTEEIKNFLSEQLVNLLSMLISVVFALFCITLKSAMLAVFAFCSIPIMVGFSFWFHEGISKAFLSCDEEDSKLSVIAQDNLTGIRVVRAFGGERREQARFSKQNHHATNKWIDLDKYLVYFWCTADVITGAVVLGYLAIGSWLCVRSSLTVGNFVAAISYLIILIQPVRNMGRVLSEMSKADVSINRIDEIMRVPEEKDAADAAADTEVPMDCDIIFSHVDFTYPDGTEKVLKDVSFTIKAGETIGMLGNTGSGKSTIAELLTGMYEPSGGSIVLGKTDITKVHREHLRKNVGLVHQEGFLFSRSIRENLRLGHEEISEESLREAMDAACFTENVERFPDGLDTFVGERGVTLSGGQKQRAVIARTLLLDTPILIFDDALSAVDTKTDAMIRENLKHYQKERTVIIISHRISTLKDADHIIVLENGRVAEEGTHESLLRKGGVYAEVCRIQQ